MFNVEFIDDTTFSFSHHGVVAIVVAVVPEIETGMHVVSSAFTLIPTTISFAMLLVCSCLATAVNNNLCLGRFTQ